MLWRPANTGLAIRHLNLKLVDELLTSDDYLLQQMQQRQVYLVKYQLKKTFCQSEWGCRPATVLQSLWQQANKTGSVALNGCELLATTLGAE